MNFFKFSYQKENSDSLKKNLISLGVYIYQERLVLLILKHVQTTTVTNLRHRTTGQLRKVPKMYLYTVLQVQNINNFKIMNVS